MEKCSGVVIVSGGSKGLGKEIVRSLLEDGNFVATFSRSKTPFVEEMSSGCFRERFHWESVNGTDYESASSFVRDIFGRCGRIDALINNMGVAEDGILTMMSGADISRLLSLNLEGTIRITQTCTGCMLPVKQGAIINISSIIGIRGYSGLSVYSATKAGLDGFTRGLARELGPRGIRVNSIAPGYLKTEMSGSLSEKQMEQIARRTPLGRLGKTEDILETVKFLLSPGSAFITGQTIVIDGGITC
ncbi:MAG: SDR family oxidoreductase [Desulfobacteraceae bacterium]|nr:SDR family oxidoreductase [Desulfobacteraceae bacterium]